MWGAWCKTLVGGFSLGEWEPLCPRPTLPEAACNTAGGLGGAVSPPAGSGRERILAIMYIKFASNNGKISVQKKNPLWGAPNCAHWGPGAAAPFAPLLIRHWPVWDTLMYFYRLFIIQYSIKFDFSLFNIQYNAKKKTITNRHRENNVYKVKHSQQFSNYIIIMTRSNTKNDYRLTNNAKKCSTD